MVKRPLVSILTPSFNQAQFLPLCLESVRQQSYEPIEHIVQDGASTDGSVRVLQAIGLSGSVDWASHPDRGQTDALLKAYARSRGDIVGWLNSDDALAHRDVVSQVVRAFVARPDVGAVIGDALMVDSRGRVILTLAGLKPRSWSVRLGSYVCQPAVFLRRSTLDEFGFLSDQLEFAMDYELWLRLLSHGVKFGVLSTVIAIDRQHGGRKGVAQRPQQDAEVEMVRGRRGAGASALWALWRVAYRLSGLARVHRADQVKLFDFVHVPSAPRRWLNQAVMRRRALS